MPEKIRQHPTVDFDATALLLHKSPMKFKFNFDLANHATGAFSANVDIGELDNETVNPVGKPLGLFYVKTGKMSSGTISITGNKTIANAKISMLYDDLHLVPLKAGPDGDLKKKRVSGWIGNILFIKNSNPKDGEIIRRPEYNFVRKPGANFFSLLWNTTLKGILLTFGIPVKLVIKE
jgi:hypothetical protein